jgi:acyl dehydratase
MKPVYAGATIGVRLTCKEKLPRINGKKMKFQRVL